MNEIIDTTARTPSTIAAEIRFLDKQAATTCIQFIIEIGRRLVEAKAMVGDGNWLQYIKTELNYERSTANNYMKLYRHDRVQDFEVAEAQELAKLREERRWIPAGERLPKIQLWCEDDDDGVHTRYYRSAPVVVCWDGGSCKAEYHESREVIDGQETNVQVCWLSHGHGELDCVTHWAHLPKPPEVDG